MLSRLLDDSYSPQVRNRITLLTVCRLSANSAYRFAPPFLATIARGFDVSLGRVALALSISELGGLAAPIMGRFVDRWPRRSTISLGLAGIGAAATLAAASPNVTVFTVALFSLALAKIMFDIAIVGWVSERVSFDKRGRALGVTELAWAGGLLIGVPIMGLATWATSWHAGYALVAVAVITMSILVARLLEGGVHADIAVSRQRADLRSNPPAATGIADQADRPLAAGCDDDELRRPSSARVAQGIAPLMLANLCLMVAAQSAFVTFGSWLEDEFGFSAGALAAVSFGLGIGELIASSSTVRFTDAWGKRRSVAVGASLMVPSGLLLAALHHHVGIGLVLLAVYVLGFEFAIVSSLPLATSILPGRPSTGIGIVFVAGTLGRAATSVPAARLYERHSLSAPLLVGTVFALACAISIQFVHEPGSSA